MSQSPPDEQPAQLWNQPPNPWQAVSAQPQDPQNVPLQPPVESTPTQPSVHAPATQHAPAAQHASQPQTPQFQTPEYQPPAYQPPAHQSYNQAHGQQPVTYGYQTPANATASGMPAEPNQPAPPTSQAPVAQYDAQSYPAQSYPAQAYPVASPPPGDPGHVMPAVAYAHQPTIHEHALGLLHAHLDRVSLKHFGHFKAIYKEAGLLVLIALGILIAGFVFLLTQSPGEMFIVLGLALGPAIPLLGLGMWLDRHEPEPIWLLIRCFLWGAAVATLVAGFVNSFVAALMGEFAAAVISAPLIEEAMKGAALLWILRYHDEHLHGRLDAAVYAIFVGIGFAVVENVQYYAMGLDSAGAGGLAGIVLLRGIMLPFMHPFFTLATAMGIAAAARHRGPKRFWYPVLGYIVAVLLHSMWNSGIGILLFPFLLAPVFIYAAVRAVKAGNVEERSVRAAIDSAVAYGALPPDAAMRLGPGTRPKFKEWISAVGKPDHPRHEMWRQRHLAWIMASGHAADLVAMDDPYQAVSRHNIQEAACAMLGARLLSHPG